MKEKWYLYTKKADFNALGQKFHISPVLARIIRNRDVLGEDAIRKYLHGTVDDMYVPMQLKGMDKSVEILQDKFKENKRIRIIGDYDIDGVCSTYILYQGLSRCGADVDYEIPDRIRDGYGINQDIIKAAHEDGIDTLVTCDNGISALAAIQYAKDLGLTVIVTDHHDVPVDDDGNELLVSADAIINPKQEGCSYPFKGLCGAVVAYKLIEALYIKKGLAKSVAHPLLEYAAIATIGDVMDLQDENRIIVRYGLSLLRKTRNYGLRALIKVNELNPEAISSYHIGFVIGPCLNAGGRLDTAKLALKLLLAENPEEAEHLARELKQLNDKRKSMTQQGVEQALQMIADHHMDRDKVLIVLLEDCHESLAGIIAGRVREKFEKPAIVLTRTEHGLKGSGRSIECYHMFQALTECREYLNKFGGHPMAAGLSMDEEKLEGFRRKMNENAALTEEDFIKKIWIDVPMPLEYITEEIINELSLLEPFGKGNPKPVFAQKDLRIRRLSILGKNANVVKMMLVAADGSSLEGILFKNMDEFFALLQKKYGPQIKDKLLQGAPSAASVSIVYYPSVNEYNGSRTLQVVIEHFSE